MRHQLIAKENVDERIGDRHFEVKAGESIEVSAKGAEIALSTGKFEYGKEIPETQVEKKRAEEALKLGLKEVEKTVMEKFRSLMKLNKDELFAEAEKLGLADFSELNKEPLAKMVAEASVKGGN